MKRVPALQDFLDKMAKDIGLTDHERMILDVGASHPYECRCNICQEYWRMMPPEDNA